MARETFVRHIKNLENDLMNMGQTVIDAINQSVQALKERDMNRANWIIENDSLINKRRGEIEEECIHLIALQQPVAADLREIIAILYVTTDLERIGDHAEGIAKIAVMLGNELPVKPLVNIPLMAEKATSMLKRSLESFVNRDAKSAAAICNEDDQVDQLYDKVYHELLNYMIADPKTISKATPLIWVAHNLERIADRVTNICERTVYLVTGSIHDVNVSKY
jgi:phosphate transport system protein